MAKARPNNSVLWFVADTEAQTMVDDKVVVNKSKEIRTSIVNNQFDPIKRKQLEHDLVNNRLTECNEMTTYLLGYSPVYNITSKTIDKTEHNHDYWLKRVNHWFTDSNEDLWHHMFDDIIDRYGKRIKKGGKYKAVIFFHNLNYDIQNFVSSIIEHKLQVSDLNLIWNNTYYNASFTYEGHVFELRDSYKIYAQSLAKLAKLVGWEKQTNLATYDWFNLKQDKKELDNEIKYFKYDIAILGAVIRMYRKEFPYPRKGKLTIAGHAEYEFKKVCKEVDDQQGRNIQGAIFDPDFSDNMDTFLRGAYYGGFVYANKDLVNQTLHNGLVADVNSLYPSVMKNQDYPDWRSLRLMGEKEFNELDLSDLHVYGIVDLQVNYLKLKPGKVPCIPKKAGIGNPHEVIDLSDMGEGNRLRVTTIDLYHITKNYDIQYTYLQGLRADRYMGKPFRPYVLKFEKMKEEAGRAGDKIKRQTAKLLLNSVYGKFAQSLITEKSELYDDDGIAKVRQFEDPERQDHSELTRHNILLAVYVTAFARHTLLTMIDQVTDSDDLTFWYCDTDSVHVGYSGNLDRLKDFERIFRDNGIDYDDQRFGAWKCEQQIKTAVYLGSKRYWEVDDHLGKDIIKGAGIDNQGKQYLIEKGIEYFKYFKDRPMIVPYLASKKVKGGVKLYDTIKEIKPTDWQIQNIEGVLI